MENAAAYTVFPRDEPSLLLDRAFYFTIFEQKPSLKLLRVLSRAAHAGARDRMLEDIRVHATETKAHACDYVHANALSQASRVFYAKLSEKHNRMTPTDFVAWVRFFVRLPQIPCHNGPTKFPGLDYQAEKCLNGKCKQAAIDLHGNHTHGKCASASAGLHYKHKLLSLCDCRDSTTYMQCSK